MFENLARDIMNMEREAEALEGARGDKREVGSINRLGKEEVGDTWQLNRVPLHSRKIIEMETSQTRRLAKRSAEAWMRRINALPDKFQSKVLHIVYWDFPSKDLNKLLTHEVEEVDELELAIALYAIGYSATKALARAKRAEDYLP